MPNLDLTALAGLTPEESRRAIIEEFNKRSADCTLKAHFNESEPSFLPVIVSGQPQREMDWPDIDLNLMALIVGVMTWQERINYARKMVELGSVAPDGHDGCWDNISDWLLTADAHTRFIAALLALGLEVKNGI